jgi:hypothetical protein
MGIEQHLVDLAAISNQPECATGAQLHVGDLDASKQAQQRELVAEVHPPDFSRISMLITLCSPAQKVSRSS